MIIKDKSILSKLIMNRRLFIVKTKEIIFNPEKENNQLNFYVAGLIED